MKHQLFVKERDVRIRISTNFEPSISLEVMINFFTPLRKKIEEMYYAHFNSRAVVVNFSKVTTSSSTVEGELTLKLPEVRRRPNETPLETYRRGMATRDKFVKALRSLVVDLSS